MSERPTPVVICSSLTPRGAETTLQAMAAGAVEIITKPTTGLKNFLLESAPELVSAIRAAAQVNVRNLGKRPAPIALTPATKLTADAMLPAANGHAMAQTTERIVALGTSTGGTQALEAVLTALPRVCPGIVIVQHMPEKNSPPRLPPGSTACARSKCARPATTTVSTRAWRSSHQAANT
nr:hypothetical protein GCM10020185_66820 [Pseudomonas brassicacearum subsp. brassicacearum]